MGFAILCQLSARQEIGNLRSSYADAVSLLFDLYPDPIKAFLASSACRPICQAIDPLTFTAEPGCEGYEVLVLGIDDTLQFSGQLCTVFGELMGQRRQRGRQ